MRSLPVVLIGFTAMGATSVGCQAGEVTPDPGDAAVGDGGAVCTPASCAGLAAPAIAKVCPDGTTVTASVCEDQGGGRCGWGFPACPVDACAGPALPCVPCPYGSVGVGKDEDGCDTCPICAPPPDASPTSDACPPPPVCNLPNCAYGVVPQTDANGCAVCPICAPAPDAGNCQCGPPPPVAACPGGQGPSVTCVSTPAGSCSWVVGSCPTAEDAGASCTSDSDCPSGHVCGFLETGGCGIEGTCFPAPEAICNVFLPGCACDGSVVNLTCNGLPTGHALKPLRHTGSCVDGG
ncbi:MAG TPA: hypothetical protein VGM06_16380 [Polyangiaceae bacterium]